jgi:hypothetical protein
VHPQQRALEPEIEEIWIAATADAGLDVDQCLLYLLDGRESESGYSGWHFHAGLHIYEAEHFGAEVNGLLEEMNSEECIDATRIIVWSNRTVEGIAALIRHELEHAVQNAAHGLRVEELYHLAMQVILVRVGGVPGGGLFYATIPNELDANAASAAFVRERYGEERIRELLDAGDADSGAFRSLVGPAPVEMLPERLLAFFMLHRDLCEAYAEQQGFEFPQLLDLRWHGAGEVWRQLVDEDGVALPR